MSFREVLLFATLTMGASSLAAAPAAPVAPLSPALAAPPTPALPAPPTLDDAGNYPHDPDVTTRVILVSSTGVLIECSQPQSAAHPAAVWRERYTIQDGKIVLAAIITRHFVPPTPAHDEWDETTLSHTAPEPRPRAPTPTIITQTNSAANNVGPTAFDARWSGFSPYLNKVMSTVQAQWDHIRITNKVYPKSGTQVTVKFVLNGKGEIPRITNVDSAPGTPDIANRTCVAAITGPAPYGVWTDEMIATLGPEQDMTLTFFYP